jgi:hypothetical protein
MSLKKVYEKMFNLLFGIKIKSFTNRIHRTYGRGYSRNDLKIARCKMFLSVSYPSAIIHLHLRVTLYFFVSLVYVHVLFYIYVLLSLLITALLDCILLQGKKTSVVCYSMSERVEFERKRYKNLCLSGCVMMNIITTLTII